MSDSPNDLYDALASGAAEVPTDPRLIGAMRQRVVEAQRSSSVEDRHQALAVASAMTDKGGFDWMLAFAADPDVAIRREAFELGRGAGDEGMSVVRAFVDDPDPDLTLEVLAVLTQRADRTATTRVRSLLGAPDPRVRAATAHLLGYIAGPVVRPNLSHLLDDDDARVRTLAQQAIARIDGELARTPTQSWTDALSPSQATPGPIRGTQAASAPQAPSPAAAGPRDAVAVLRELGQPNSDIAARVAELRTLRPTDVSAAINAYTTGGPPDYGVGSAIAAQQLGAKTSVSPLKRWLSDPDPRVRAASASALASLGGPAILNGVAALVTDPDSHTAQAAILALVGALKRLEMTHMAQGWLAPALKSDDEARKTVATEALASLKAT